MLFALKTNQDWSIRNESRYRAPLAQWKCARRKGRGTRVNYFQFLSRRVSAEKPQSDQINGRVSVADFFRSLKCEPRRHHIDSRASEPSKHVFTPWARLDSPRYHPRSGTVSCYFAGCALPAKRLRWSGRWSIVAFNDRRRCVGRVIPEVVVKVQKVTEW